MAVGGSGKSALGVSLYASWDFSENSLDLVRTSKNFCDLCWPSARGGAAMKGMPSHPGSGASPAAFSGLPASGFSENALDSVRTLCNVCDLC